MSRIGQEGWSKRWAMGTGGFLGEVTLQTLPPQYIHVARPEFRCVALTNLFVHPLRRNRGWADILLNTAVKFAEVNKLDLFLWAQPYGDVPGAQTKTLLALYTRHGFVRLSKRSVQMVRRYGA